MIEVVENIVTCICLAWFCSYIIIIDVKANKKLKEGRYYDKY